METLLIKSNGKEFACLYDRMDQKLIGRHKWSYTNGYAATNIKGKTVLMHRLLCGVVDKPEIQVDHKFHNKLDNRRGMIRVCTPSENRRNSRKIMQGSSNLKGIYRDGKYWHAQIFKSERVLNLGRYRSEITAAKVYDLAAKQIFKEFACLNFPEFELEKQMELPGFK